MQFNTEKMQFNIQYPVHLGYTQQISFHSSWRRPVHKWNWMMEPLNRVSKSLNLNVFASFREI